MLCAAAAPTRGLYRNLFTLARARPRCLLLLPNAALARARDTTMIFMLNNLSTTPIGHLVEDVASRLAADLLIYLNLLF